VTVGRGMATAYLPRARDGQPSRRAARPVEALRTAQAAPLRASAPIELRAPQRSFVDFCTAVVIHEVLILLQERGWVTIGDEFPIGVEWCTSRSQNGVS